MKTSKQMRAAVYHEFGGPIRVVDDMPRPTACSADAVILKVMATGVCRSDWHGWKGHDGDIKEHGLPFVPGHELSGIVVHVGSSVTKFQRGDAVAVPFILSCGACDYCCRYNRPTVCSSQQQPGFTVMGSFAEYVVLPRADRNLCKLPENVSFVQAAALGCRFTTAYRAVIQQGNLEANQTIAVFGCGGLGLSCIMLAKAANASTIIGIDVSEQTLQKAKELGATHTILQPRNAITKKESNEYVRQHVLDLTDGQGVDVSVDAAGFVQSCENAVWCTRRAGRMIQVGLLGDQQPDIPMDLIAGREIEVFGSHGFAATDLPALLELVATNQLDPSKLVQRQVTLEEGARAIEEMDHASPLGITMVTQFENMNEMPPSKL